MNDTVLLAYARSMRSAQRLEGRVKILLSLHNVTSGVSKNWSTLAADEVLGLFRAGDKTTLGQALDAVFQKLGERGLSPFPDEARKALWETVRVRNFVAHHYFEQRKVLGGDENAWPYLLAELDWFSELFETWVPRLDKWIDMLVRALGLTEDEMKSGLQVLEEIAPDLRREQLKALKDKLERIGIDVPPPPTPAGQTTVAPDARTSRR